tara:strand:+ start:112 stop:330 length:219 start_codon:yes stop_codon:yes gene_type:complete
MSKVSEIDLGSSLLSIFIAAGFVATAFVFIRITIIGINYIKANYLKEEVSTKKTQQSKNVNKGFEIDMGQKK